MSSATTIHDGCESLVNLLLLCIILIVFMSIRHYCLCTCIFIFTFVTLSSYKRANSLQKYEKELDYMSDFIIFCMSF